MRRLVPPSLLRPGPPQHGERAWWTHVTLFTLNVVLTVSATVAQPSMRITRVDVAWPRVSCTVQAACDDVPVTGLTKLDFKVTENEMAVPGFSLSCPSYSTPCPMHVALVIDMSGSMMGTPIEQTKFASRAFIAECDGVRDTAAVISFSHVVRVAQSPTSDRSALFAAIDGLAPSGMTAMRDGAKRGLQTIAQGSGCRAILLLTDGRDNTSMTTESELVALALQLNIPIYVISIGMSVDDALLERLATSTGGRAFFTMTPADLARIFQLIARTVKFSGAECTLTWDASCSSTDVRSVSITATGPCAPLTADTSYQAPAGTGISYEVRIQPHSVRGGGGTEIRVPVTLPDTTPPLVFSAADVEISYDPALLTFEDVRLPAASILLPAGTSVLEERPGRVRCRIDSAGTVRGSGVLFDVHFRAGIVQDSVCTRMHMTRWIFDNGCLVPRVDSAMICIVPCPSPPTLRIDGGTVLCAGDSVRISAPAGHQSYRWSRDGLPLPGNVPDIIARLPGVYSLEITTADGCDLDVPPFELRDGASVSYRFTTPRAVHAGVSTGSRIPIHVHPPFLTDRPVDITVLMREPTGLLCFEGWERDGTSPGEWAMAEVHHTREGTRLRVRGWPTASDSSLGVLRYSLPDPPALARYLTGELIVERIETDCLLGASGSVVPILVDGRCERIVDRMGEATVSVHPNPASALVTVRYRMQGDGARLTVSRMDGTPMTRLDTPVRDGGSDSTESESTVQIDVRTWPSGVYRIDIDGKNGRRSGTTFIVLR